jgi:hypothetical protein
MDIHRLIKMTSEIGAFFEAEPDRITAMEGIAGHHFWDRACVGSCFRRVDEHEEKAYMNCPAAIEIATS